MRPGWKENLLPVLAVLVAGLAGVLTVATALPVSVRVGLSLLGIAAGVGLVVAWSLRRGAQVERITAEVRRMLAPGHGPSVEAARSLTSSVQGGPQDELAELRTTLGQLGQRMATQVKETAKKGRNLESVLDALVDPVIVTDQADEVLMCNAAAERLFAAPRGTLAGRPVQGLLTRREILDLHHDAHKGTSGSGRVTLTTEAGPRVFDVAAAPLPNAWGTGVFGVLLVLRDITSLAQAVQMQTDFVANASHELRTPIAAIKAATETLAGGAIDEPVMRGKLMGTIGTHAMRLEELVHDLMDLSRLETPTLSVEIEPISWPELVASIRQTFDPACATKGIRLQLVLDPACVGFASDRRLVGLILRNFIDNAVKFAFADSTIDAQITRTPAGVRIEVADSGQGIPLSHQERVWERFYQVDAARTGFSTRRGTGLGLAIVRHAVGVLKGEVGLTSTWGQGTRVWAELPWCQLQRDEDRSIGGAA
ncbi:MAG: ATP-binding protein [bacterium]